MYRSYVILHITGRFVGTYLRGSSSPMVPYLLSSFLPPLLTFFELANSQSLHGFLLVFEGKERGDLDPHFHQSLSPLCEGNPLDLDLGVLRVLLSFFLSFSSLALVALVGFGREGLGHSVCPCHCIWCIGLSSPRDTWKLQVEKLITLGCLVPLRSFILGAWAP